MADLQNYFHAQTIVKLRRAEGELASARLELARIKERMAEIDCQHDPVNKMTELDDPHKAMRDLVTYVVIGRFPNG